MLLIRMTDIPGLTNDALTGWTPLIPHLSQVEPILTLGAQRLDQSPYRDELNRMLSGGGNFGGGQPIAEKVDTASVALLCNTYRWAADWTSQNSS